MQTDILAARPRLKTTSWRTSISFRLLATHEVTWAYQDSFCANQYAFPEQPEEFPSMPVKTVIRQLPQTSTDLSFEKFNFTKEDDEDD